MPVIKVWCLPKMSQNKLRQLHKNIVAAVCSVKKLGLVSEKQMTCLFPQDMMTYGLGEEVIIEITGFFEKPERTEEVRNRLAGAVGYEVSSMFQNAHVECFVYPFNPTQGFWQNLA